MDGAVGVTLSSRAHGRSCAHPDVDGAVGAAGHENRLTIALEREGADRVVALWRWAGRRWPSVAIAAVGDGPELVREGGHRRGSPASSWAVVTGGGHRLRPRAVYSGGGHGRWSRALVTGGGHGRWSPAVVTGGGCRQ